MKHFVIIALFLLAATPALAQDRAPEKIVILKTTSEQRALTELLSARIKSALLGENYVPVAECKARNCEIPSR
jgi:hypothetical protein